MRIINKKYLLIILLIGVLLIGVIIFKPREEVQLDNVILKQELNNKTFAMYTETDSGYEEYKDNKFPEGYVLNINESKCIDNNGKEVDNILGYKNGEITVTSGKTTFCYLYFDKSLGLEIKEKNTNRLSTEVNGEMYRFQGQQSDNVKNYICFGTNDKNTCVNDTNHYMYRIIGIEASTGRVKVIKKETLKEAENGTYQWYTDYDHDIKFPESIIYKAISGSDFLENPNFVPEGWEEKISDNTWMYGDMWSNDTIGARQEGPELYKTETGKKETRWYNYATADTLGSLSAIVEDESSPYKGQTVYYTNGSGYWTQSFTGKVSLMYLHDYYLSVSNTANCQLDAGQYTECQTGWMHLSQNDSSVTGNGVHEWTMSRFGWTYWFGYFYGRVVDSIGSISHPSLVGNFSVRPTFYINASEELLDGEGTLEHPFIIK